MAEPIETLRERIEALESEIRTLADRDEITADEDARLDEALTERESALAEFERLEAREARLAAFRDTPTPSVRTMDVPNVNTRTESNAFDLSELRTATGEDLAERAQTIVERHLPGWVDDNAREDATRLLDGTGSFRGSARDFDEVARHIVRTSDPEYVKAFKSYVNDPMAGPSPILTDTGARAAMSLTAANGGVLVPQFLDPTIILTNSGAENPLRGMSSVAQITVDQWDGVTSAGVTAEWLGENSEAADKTPTFVGPTITVHKEAAFLFGSYEVIADSGFNEVGRLIADAFDRLEATAMVTGTGSSQPYGVVTRLSGTGPVVAGAQGDAGAATFSKSDVYALDNALGTRWRQNAQWLTSRYFANVIRASVDSLTNYWQDFGAGSPSSLLGYAVNYASAMGEYPTLGAVGATTITSGSNDYPIILGDFENYKIVDRIGTTVQFIPVLFGSSQRPQGQSGWFAYKRVGADVLTSNAFKTLKL